MGSWFGITVSSCVLAVAINHNFRSGKDWRRSGLRKCAIEKAGERAQLINGSALRIFNRRPVDQVIRVGKADDAFAQIHPMCSVYLRRNQPTVSLVEIRHDSRRSVFELGILGTRSGQKGRSLPGPMVGRLRLAD